MKIIINGKDELLPSGISLSDLITLRGLNKKNIIIEYNQELVKEEDWAGITLKENDRIEIMRFVGGG